MNKEQRAKLIAEMLQPFEEKEPISTDEEYLVVMSELLLEVSGRLTNTIARMQSKELTNEQA